MYLYRWHCHVKNGKWREFMSIVSEVNRLYEAKGHTKMRFWAGVTGTANFFVAESEFDSLSSWEAEDAAISSDPEIMDTLRQTVNLMDTTEFHELLVSAPEIA